jgi:hypothetical protein
MHTVPVVMDFFDFQKSVSKGAKLPAGSIGVGFSRDLN